MHCCECKNFMGGGDFGLCCKVNYELCYEDTPGCDKFIDSGDRLFVKEYSDGEREYRFGESWESARLFVDNGFKTPQIAYQAKQIERAAKKYRRKSNG